MNSCIYKIEGPEQWVYVGQTNNKNARWANHRSKLRRGIHDNIHLQRSWSKHGESAFNFMVVEYAAPDQLSALEQQHLDLALATLRCFNKAPIADPPRGWFHDESVKQSARERSTGVIPSELTRQRMSQAQRNRQPLSPEAKARMAAKISAAHKGKSVSRETREKIRAAKLGVAQSPESNAKRAATQLGQRRGEAFAKKCSEAKKLNYATNPEYKLKLSAAMRDRANSPEFIAKAKLHLPDNRRQIRCSDGTTYASIVEASRATGVSVTTISVVVNGHSSNENRMIKFWVV